MKEFKKIIFITLSLFLLLLFSCSNNTTTNKSYNNLSSILSIPDTFEEFEKTVYKEPFPNGIYIVNGDTPMENIKELKKFYKKLVDIKNKLSKQNNDTSSPRKLIIEKFEDDTINKWSDSQKLELTYCISRSTAGYSYNRIIRIMDEATASWETAANVDFIHLSEYDNDCNETTEEVLFDVRLRYGITYEARSFFPGQSRKTRNIIINSGFVYQMNYLTGLLKHELGHVLGFRHEHIRPEANSSSDQCMDYNYGYWEPLTEYDSDSVMHYPQCNGSADSFELTELDIEGARKVYGASGEDPVDPVIPPELTTETLVYESQFFNRGKMIYYDPIVVLPGTKIQIEMTGTGDADIYLKFDSQPRLFSYDTRAYEPDSNESIVKIVPTLARKAYIMIHGYKTSIIDLKITYQMKKE